MPLVEYDHMIEQVSPAITDEAFCDSVLPRTAETGPLRFDPKALDGGDDRGVKPRLLNAYLQSNDFRRSILDFQPGSVSCPKRRCLFS
jgi:hypothetical protein